MTSVRLQSLRASHSYYSDFTTKWEQESIQACNASQKVNVFFSILFLVPVPHDWWETKTRGTFREKLEALLRWTGEDRAALWPPQPEVRQLFTPKPHFRMFGSSHTTTWTAIPLLPEQTSLLWLVCHNAMENIRESLVLPDRSSPMQHLVAFVGEGEGRKIFYSSRTSCGQLL